MTRTITARVHLYKEHEHLAWFTVRASDQDKGYYFDFNNGTLTFKPGLSPKTKRTVATGLTLDQAVEEAKRYLDQWLDLDESIMDVEKVELRRDGERVFISASVYKADEYDSRYGIYAFLWEAGKVYFLIGGQIYDKRLAGEAASEDAATKMALEYLERWLGSIHAI